MASIDILVHKCIGCKQCLKECPFGAIKMEKKKAVILDNCTLCGSCVSACRFQAINFVNDEVYADILRQLINEYKPEIVLFGATTYGRSLAPRIASKLNTGLTADCTILEIDEEKKLLLQTRPAFGGNLMATIICPNHRPQMATVRPKVMKAIEPNFNRTGHI